MCSYSCMVTCDNIYVSIQTSIWDVLLPVQISGSQINQYDVVPSQIKVNQNYNKKFTFWLLETCLFGLLPSQKVVRHYHLSLYQTKEPDQPSVLNQVRPLTPNNLATCISLFFVMHLCQPSITFLDIMFNVISLFY
jgi:hypothetical protein